ncbi:MAG: hypothetical protein GPOALKHO_000432 [Sodalis sp.]|nr:MAG: hypothetical protein GPOALKHO_000432 [Sodalis sp.]
MFISRNWQKTRSFFPSMTASAFRCRPGCAIVTVTLLPLTSGIDTVIHFYLTARSLRRMPFPTPVTFVWHINQCKCLLIAWYLGLATGSPLALWRLSVKCCRVVYLAPKRHSSF